MAFLKFNKSELVNLSYSLKREIIQANTDGSYTNTSIVGCNTRRYHGLLAVPIEALGGARHMLLSSIDESLVLNTRQFNLGIHCYGDTYEPRGHKYIIDFESDPVPTITFKIGETVFTKTFFLVQDKSQFLIKYTLVKSPAKASLLLKPFLSFRSVHSLTQENSVANLAPTPIQNGMAWCLYEGFPTLNLQLNTSKAKFNESGNWYKGVTYSDEARRGFPSTEDLWVPGSFEVPIAEGESIIVSASIEEEKTTGLSRKFSSLRSAMRPIGGAHDSLVWWARALKNDRYGHKRITAGLSWLYTGLLRETLLTLPGLTLYATGDNAEFQEILDNLIADEQERLFHRTTQTEAPLLLAGVLQDYVDFGASAKAVWKKYGATVKGIIESYAPGQRKEIAMQPDGLLWGQMDGVALTWMNAYVNGRPVTERPGYQVEVNAHWYDTLCYAIEMEEAYGPKNNEFVAKWSPIRDLVKANFQPKFWNRQYRCLADYVDGWGQHMEIRPNQLAAISTHHPVVDEETAIEIVKVINKELVTRRGVRTLSPRDANYKCLYEGSQIDRDLAYHQGCTRPALLAPYIAVCLKMQGAAFVSKAEWLIKGFTEDMSKHGIGAVAEVYDADPPHEPHGAIVSATSIAALLTIDRLLDIYKK
ncbi:MAG: amylo-alpha-1,6-glucosidase [Bacteroidales bacterium]|nr:amylo-alpha-1,6-glucosidase [Bacteroidales bacterium]